MLSHNPPEKEKKKKFTLKNGRLAKYGEGFYVRAGSPFLQHLLNAAPYGANPLGKAMIFSEVTVCTGSPSIFHFSEVIKSEF